MQKPTSDRAMDWIQKLYNIFTNALTREEAAYGQRQ